MELTDSYLLAHSTEIRFGLAVFACFATYIVIKVVNAVSSAISALSANASKTAAPRELSAAAAR